jgi:hypothetical protein
MKMQTVTSHLGDNVHATGSILRNDLIAEAKHIADPAQCGNIVRRHFDGLMMALLTFVALFLVATIFGVATYTHR